jgi:hypothetical protein
VDTSDLDNRFSYHAPDEKNVEQHQSVRNNCLALAKEFDQQLPDGREKSLALTKIEEVMFWANASIARNV